MQQRKLIGIDTLVDGLVHYAYTESVKYHPEKKIEECPAIRRWQARTMLNVEQYFPDSDTIVLGRTENFMLAAIPAYLYLAVRPVVEFEESQDEASGSTRMDGTVKQFRVIGFKSYEDVNSWLKTRRTGYDDFFVFVDGSYHQVRPLFTKMDTGVRTNFCLETLVDIQDSIDPQSYRVEFPGVCEVRIKDWHECIFAVSIDDAYNQIEDYGYKKIDEMMDAQDDVYVMIEGELIYNGCSIPVSVEAERLPDGYVDNLWTLGHPGMEYDVDLFYDEIRDIDYGEV